MTDFAAILRVLSVAQVEFVLVGGVAAIAHGSARRTLDIDVVYARTPENYDKLVAALGPHDPYLRGAPPGLPFHWDSETIARGLNFTLTTKLGDLDLLGEIVGGGDFDRLLQNSFTAHVFGCDVLCIELEELIRVKRAAGRPRDLEAVAELEALLHETQCNDERS